MNISEHASQRMQERGFTMQMLEDFLSNEICNIKSENHENVVLLIGKINDKFWTLIVNRETNNLITVRRSHKTEIENYDSRRH